MDYGIYSSICLLLSIPAAGLLPSCLIIFTLKCLSYLTTAAAAEDKKSNQPFFYVRQTSLFSLVQTVLKAGFVQCFVCVCAAVVIYNISTRNWQGGFQSTADELAPFIPLRSSK